MQVDLEEARKIKLRENDNKAKRNENIIVDDERSKEEYYLELMKLADPDLWNLAMREIDSYQEPQRSYAFGFMKVAYDWYLNRDRITQAQGGSNRWEQLYVPLLKRLGIKVDK